MSVLPPPLFDLEPVKPARIFTPPGTPFTPPDTHDCADCRRPLKGRWTHCVGGSTQQGHYDLCDECAAQDIDERTGRPHWGFTLRDLQIDHVRNRVYAAGGGETQVQAALTEAGLIGPTATCVLCGQQVPGYTTAAAATMRLRSLALVCAGCLHEDQPRWVHTTDEETAP